MANTKLGDVYLSKEESKDIIELLAKKRSIKNYKSKSSDRLYNIYKKQSKNKKRIDNIREELKNPKYNISKSESKDIKRNLYNIEKQRKISLKKTSKYLDELDKRILRLDKYHDFDDFEYKGIKDIENLYKILIDKDYYKPKLYKSGYNKNYAQYESKGDKILSLKEYLNLIEKYLRELLEEYKQKGEWKVQLTIEVNLISLKPGSDETRIMYTRSNNIEMMFGDDNDDIIEQLFESLLKKYEENLQNKMRGSEFEFDGINFLYYDFNKTSINRGGSYIDSPKWLKDKKSTINPKNNDDKCFQYAVTLALNLIILLMISDGQKWHYLVVKNLSRLLRGITSHHKEDFYCLNCFHSYRTENKLEAHKKIFENHDYCHVEMPTKRNNIIKYNHGEKSVKLLFVICADLKCLLEKMSTCINNPNESSTTKINKHTPSGYSIFTHCSFDKSKNKLNYYRGKDCMKKFSKDLREHASKIIDYEKKRMISLTTEEKIYHNKQKICYICKKEFNNNDKKNYKVRNHCHYTGKYRGAAHNICNLRYKVPKEIPIVFHNGSIYDYHFIIKELVKEFEGNFECLGENTEKYITFSVPIKKKIENKDLEITYKIKFIDSYRFMVSSLSKLVDDLSEGIHNNKCSDCGSHLDYIKITAERTAGPTAEPSALARSSLERKNEKLILEYYNCKQRYKKKFNKELIKRFASTYSFCNNDLNKFILLLRKGVYPYEYMDNWERFNETSLPSKESFYSNLNMEDIDDIDYRHGNNVFNKFKLNNLGDYHDLYVQSDTLLLADVFENFRDMCFKQYELDPAHLLSLSGLAWQACLKKTNIEL